MEIAEALKISQQYYDLENPMEDDDFLLTEALGYLIEETKEPKYMIELAWHYCSKKRFDLEIKYLEMAAERGELIAYEELGYMWYYGQHGIQDYQKAYECFSKVAAEDKGIDGMWCTYKLADMYRFGCAVEKDEKKYREMIEEAYEKIKNPDYLNEPYPEIAYRMAGIWIEDGRQKEAIELLYRARNFLAERLSLEVFWGHLETMERIINRLYYLAPFNENKFGLYDIFHLTHSPCRIRFRYRRKVYELEISGEDLAIKVEDKWYRNYREFCEKALLKGQRITKIYDEIHGMEVER